MNGKNAIMLHCERCGIDFWGANPDTKLCLACKVAEDMKLPPDTIVNRNLVNIWVNKGFDPVRGIDPNYLMVAEGVYLVEQRKRRPQLCTRIKFIGEKDDKHMESYARNVAYRKDIKNLYDTLVFVRIGSKSNFYVFGISYSDRMIKKLSDRTIIFKKQYAISLAIKWYLKNR